MLKQADSMLNPVDDLERTRIALYRLYMAALRAGEITEEIDGDEQEKTPCRQDVQGASLCQSSETLRAVAPQHDSPESGSSQDEVETNNAPTRRASHEVGAQNKEETNVSSPDFTPQS